MLTSARGSAENPAEHVSEHSLGDAENARYRFLEPATPKMPFDGPLNPSSSVPGLVRRSL